MALSPLPIDAILPDFLATLRASSSALLQAPTGSGKTTRVPPAVLDGLNPPGQILLLEPRRLAARAAAQRMAQEREQRLGDEIGYQVRFERQASRATRVLVVTPGILLRKMLDDPYLEDVSTLLFDEFHERGLESDLALGLARLIQQTVRPELRLVLMSATLDLQPLRRYLGDCPILQGTGQLYPVEIQYRPAPSARGMVEAAADAVLALLEATPGDLLVFLPGVGEIRQAAEILDAVAREHGVLLLPLHGELPLDQQSEALRRHTRRKIVLATNVAETSVTVEGVTGVIDTGLARQLIFDPDLGLDRLQLLPISQASAEQRTGRAGRLEPGICVRLWSEANHRSRPTQTEAEIRRVDLAGALLHLLALGENDVAAFPWPEAPAPAALEQGLELLRHLGAIDQNSLTSLGQEMARLPVHPRLARLLLAGQANGVVDRAALVAALLSERSPFRSSGDPGQPRRPRSHSLSDVLEQVEALETFESRGTPPPGTLVPNRNAAQVVLRAQGQLLRLARDQEGTPLEATDRDEAVLRALLAAYPDRVVRRRPGDPRRGLMVGGRGVRLHPECGVTEGELFVAVAVDNQPGEALVRQASSIQREWLDPALIRSDTRLTFDTEAEQIIARKCLYYEDLLLEEGHAALPHGALVAAELERAAQSNFPRVMPDSDSPGGNLVTRLRCLTEWLPEANLPDVSENALREMLTEVCQGCRSFAQIRDRWHSLLLGRLTYEQQQLLDREAPERLEVPSGSRIQLTYEVGKPPILAVRIQELFGLATTPTVALGRIRVLLHLLGPNYRPQQMTSDLASFWLNTYPQVRKELRARYPRHSWPDDPLSAPALRGPRKRTD